MSAPNYGAGPAAPGHGGDPVGPSAAELLAALCAAVDVEALAATLQALSARGLAPLGVVDVRCRRVLRLANFAAHLRQEINDRAAVGTQRTGRPGALAETRHLACEARFATVMDRLYADDGRYDWLDERPPLLELWYPREAARC